MKKKTIAPFTGLFLRKCARPEHLLHPQTDLGWHLRRQDISSEISNDTDRDR